MFFPAPAHRFFFLFGIVSMGFGIMMGAVPTSVPQFILLINWLLEGGFHENWRRIRYNRVFWATELIFLIHVIGMFYTSDLNEGFKDLQIKLPLLILPVVFFSSTPLTQKEIRLALQAFLIGCLINTLWSLFYSMGLHDTLSARKVSRFMSHIRLGLYLNIALLVCLKLFSSEKRKVLKWIYVLLFVYFLATMLTMGLATGLFIFVLLLLAIVIYATSKLKPIYTLVVLFLSILGFYAGWNYVKRIYNNQHIAKTSSNNEFKQFSAAGNMYLLFDSLGRKENGFYIQRNIQLDELQRVWNRRNPLDSFSIRVHQYNLKRYEALIRYLAGKGLAKDSVGVMSLSAEDIRNISNNIPNHNFNNWSFIHQRVYELVNEYDDLTEKRNVNGNSVTMRYYFWKAAVFSIQQNFWFGTGTGDVKNTMLKSYKDSNSPLNAEWQKRPHNQFLTIAVAFGVLGLTGFLFSLLYPLFRLYHRVSPIYLGFLFVCLLSFLSEDTLETQAGATFFSFFNTFLVAEAFFKKPQNPEN